MQQPTPSPPSLLPTLAHKPKSPRRRSKEQDKERILPGLAVLVSTLKTRKTARTRALVCFARAEAGLELSRCIGLVPKPPKVGKIMAQTL